MQASILRFPLPLHITHYSLLMQASILRFPLPAEVLPTATAANEATAGPDGSCADTNGGTSCTFGGSSSAYGGASGRASPAAAYAEPAGGGGGQPPTAASSRSASSASVGRPQGSNAAGGPRAPRKAEDCGLFNTRLVLPPAKPKAPTKT